MGGATPLSKYILKPAPQIVEIRETVREIEVIEKQVNPPLFGGFEADYLFALGVPHGMAGRVRLVSGQL